MAFMVSQFDDFFNMLAPFYGHRALLGIDYGKRYIGIALSDAGWKMSTPYEQFDKKRQKAPGIIKQIIQKEKIAGVIIGLPLNMDGTPGPMAQASKDFATFLETMLTDVTIGPPYGMAQLQSSAHALPVTLYDERLSSYEAKEIYQAPPSKIHKISAAIMLQSALDALGRMK